MFKQQLELGHNQEAFTAMMANPDPSRRKGCLRQLLVVLSERGELQALVEFPYKDLEDEVCAYNYKMECGWGGDKNGCVFIVVMDEILVKCLKRNWS